MFSYVNEDSQEEETNNCKTLTQKIRVYCVESVQSRPEPLLERNKVLNMLTLGYANRYPEHIEDITISGETILKLKEIKEQIKSDFQKLYPKCDIIVRDT